jgi:hypothetical protein
MRNPLSIEAFTEWCEKKPAGEEYNYDDKYNCAFGQYLQSLGFESASVGGYHWRPSAREESRVFPHPAMVGALATNPYTFGSLSKRLRAAMAEG